MSRENGWLIADISTSLIHDPKVAALSRRLQDPVRTMAALGLYVAVVLASWHEGTRVRIDEAWPLWWPAPAEDLVAALVAVGLLDGETGKVPLHTWQGWYGPADRRRTYGLRQKALGGLRAHGMSVEEALAELDRREAAKAAEFAGSLEAEPKGPASKPGIPTNKLAGQQAGRLADSEESALSGAEEAPTPPTNGTGKPEPILEVLQRLPLAEGMRLVDPEARNVPLTREEGIRARVFGESA